MFLSVKITEKLSILSKLKAIIVEEKKLRMMKLRSKDVVLAACYGEEPEVSTAKRISLILQDGGGMGAEGSFNLSGLRLYAAGELGE